MAFIFRATSISTSSILRHQFFLSPSKIPPLKLFPQSQNKHSRWASSGCGKQSCGCRSSGSSSSEFSICAELSSEHRVIEWVLSGIESQSAALDGAIKEDKDDVLNFYSRAVTFLQEFSDDFHHYKEEQILFPHMGLRFSDPINMMLLEHDEGRDYLQQMTECLKEIEKEEDSERLSRLFEELRDSSLGYTELMRTHIQKEDRILFPNIESSVDQETKAKIASRFADHFNETNKKSSLQGHVEWASNFDS
jgi:hemerythrin-like domain-containing protein